MLKTNYIVSRLRKLIFTLKTIKETVNNQYGHGPMNYLRFLYYSGLRVNTFIVFENDLNRELPEHNLDSDFKVIKPTLEKLSLIREGKKLPREFYHDKIDNVKTCYLAFHGSEVAYIHWVYFKGDDSRFLILSDGVAELNYITTIPKFRGRRLSARMVAYASKDLQDSGYKKAMAVTFKYNISSIICLKQAGFIEIKEIMALGPFHRKLKV